MRSMLFILQLELLELLELFAIRACDSYCNNLKMSTRGLGLFWTSENQTARSLAGRVLVMPAQTRCNATRCGLGIKLARRAHKTKIRDFKA